MIVVKGEIRVKADGKDDALAALGPAIETTRAEAGNAAYVYARDIADPNLIHVFEEWADEDALNAHMVAPHVAELMGAVAGVMESASFTRYDATGSRSLF